MSAGTASVGIRGIRLGWLKPWHIAAFAALIVASYFFWSWWVSPEHRIAQFRAAFDGGSLSGMLSLASTDEVTHLGLTPAKLSSILNDAAISPDGVKIARLKLVRTNDAQYRYNRVFFCDLSDREGHPLIDHFGQTAQVYLIAYNSTTGWHIALSKFLIGISRERRPGRYASICRQHNVPAEVFEPEDATWRLIAN